MAKRGIPYLIYCKFDSVAGYASLFEAISSNYVSKKISDFAIIILAEETENAQDIFNKLTKHIESDIVNTSDFLVIKWGPYFANLPKSTWDWINENIPTIPFSETKK
ncbi:MAG: hypothetical protein ACXVPU_07595 [Bacteroidia bacterium]